MDADAVQAPSDEVSPRTEPQPCSQMFEVNDALRHYMLPCLRLHNIMQLAGTCRAWQLLIADTTLHHLSQEACQAVLPSDLTTSLPLLQLIKQQAQLLARLRGKHGFTPGIQHLSFSDEPPDSTPKGNVQGSRSVRLPQLYFRAIHWSPCTCLEEPSRWLALDPHRDCKHLPTVIDMSSGQQVCFEQGQLSMHLDSHNVPSLHAAWLTGKPDQILIFPSTAQMSASIAWMADARSQSILPVKLPEAQSQGASHFFTVSGEDDAAINILCWSTRSPIREGTRSFTGQISIFDVSSRQLLYQLSCIKQLHKRLQMEADDFGTRCRCPTSSRELQDGALRSCRPFLSPDKKLFGIVWRYSLVLGSGKYRVVCLGVSVHSALTGDLKYSKPLMRATRGYDHPCLPSWLPCSSNLIHVSEGGLLQSTTTSGCRLWSNARADRAPEVSSSEHSIDTSLSASPCGRWILVVDDEAPQHCRWKRNRASHITVLEASTGQNLAVVHRHGWYGDLEGKWSMSGEICMLAELDCVLVYCPQVHPMFKVFQQCKLGRPDAHSIPTGHDMSLSPCGRTVIDLHGLSTVGLQHWQIPPSSAIVKEAAVISSRTMPCFIYGEFNMDQQDKPSGLQAAWHPLRSARIYAIACSTGGVHIIDAKGNRRVQSWSEDEVHGPAVLSDPAEEEEPDPAEDVVHRHHSDELDDYLNGFADRFSVRHDYDETVRHALSWSKDGCRLAVASGASLTCSARCSVLHFSDSIT